MYIRKFIHDGKRIWGFFSAVSGIGRGRKAGYGDVRFRPFVSWSPVWIVRRFVVSPRSLSQFFPNQ